MPLAGPKPILCLWVPCLKADHTNAGQESLQRHLSCSLPHTEAWGPGLPGSHPQTVAAWDPCSRSSVQRVQMGERKRELSHPELFSQVSLRRIKMLFGPVAQRQNRRWKYLFVSKALPVLGWKAHLGCNLLQVELAPWQALPKGSLLLVQILGKRFHSPIRRKGGSLSQQKLNFLNENYPLWASGIHK